MEREREREAARITGTRVLHHDPYRYKDKLFFHDMKRIQIYSFVN